MTSRQGTFWKLFLMRHIVGDQLATEHGLFSAFSFPIVEEYLAMVLGELKLSGLIALLDARLQIAAVSVHCDKDKDPVWAYFPVHRHRRILKQVAVHPNTRILLVFFLPDVESHPKPYILNKIRHHLAHVLLYLDNPKVNNECDLANEVWKLRTK